MWRVLLATCLRVLIKRHDRKRDPAFPAIHRLEAANIRQVLTSTGMLVDAFALLIGGRLRFGNDLGRWREAGQGLTELVAGQAHGVGGLTVLQFGLQVRSQPA